MPYVRTVKTAYDGGGQVRDGAWVAEITGLLDLTGWPEGVRVIVRKERPHPGAQLRFTDLDGHRFTCLVTNTATGQLANLELRHRRRARQTADIDPTTRKGNPRTRGTRHPERHPGHHIDR